LVFFVLEEAQGQFIGSYNLFLIVDYVPKKFQKVVVPPLAGFYLSWGNMIAPNNHSYTIQISANKLIYKKFKHSILCTHKVARKEKKNIHKYIKT
jgi:hypothetical protein